MLASKTAASLPIPSHSQILPVNFRIWGGGVFEAESHTGTHYEELTT